MDKDGNVIVNAPQSSYQFRDANSEAMLRGLQIELTSTVLPGKIDVWKMPDANGLSVDW